MAAPRAITAIGMGRKISAKRRLPTKIPFLTAEL
jgi:hypothetical protein